MRRSFLHLFRSGSSYSSKSILFWMARFGAPLRVTSDQGRQFESCLFEQLNRLMGTTHFRTTAYHPASNGMVERFHRQLKAAIRCHNTERWTEILPTVMLGIRSAWKKDLQATVAEMLYGETLRLPGAMLVPTQETSHSETDFVKNLRKQMKMVRPVTGTRHGVKPTFRFKKIENAKFVFLRNDGPKRPLQNPYEGPFEILSRSSKTFNLMIRGKNVTVSVDRIKPAYEIAVKTNY
ncbi:uncharacterized protein LOC113382055 [Ctenocephalides felis]|uniref:uncharacterized protein LOC113382055 n=1 Tax=Ctenocephalides felis TaxID=7515 RepID=UPI000E6E2701|nr:uncharacterized protein LOC113382055 [Ctenocephalides felis]